MTTIALTALCILAVPAVILAGLLAIAVVVGVL